MRSKDARKPLDIHTFTGHYLWPFLISWRISQCLKVEWCNVFHGLSWLTAALCMEFVHFQVSFMANHCHMQFITVMYAESKTHVFVDIQKSYAHLKVGKGSFVAVIRYSPKQPWLLSGIQKEDKMDNEIMLIPHSNSKKIYMLANIHTVIIIWTLMFGGI